MPRPDAAQRICAKTDFMRINDALRLVIASRKVGSYYGPT
jgi:hypothetical protein